MNTIWNLTNVNFKIFYRNFGALFWTLAMPLIIFIALSVLPIERFVGNTGTSFTSFLLPGIIAMSLMQGGIYGLAYWLVDLRARGVLKRFTVTPVTKTQFISGVTISRLIVMLLQVIVLTTVGTLAFGALFTPEPINVLLVILFTILGGSVFLLFGLLIATFASTYESAAPITAAIGLPMTFLGNIFYPIEILPKALQVVAKLLPMTYFAHGMRTSFLDPTLMGVGKDILILAIWLIALFALVIWRFKLEE